MPAASNKTGLTPWVVVLANLPLLGCAGIWGFDDLAVGDASVQGSDAEVDASQTDGAAPDGDAAELPVDSGAEEADSVGQLADSGGQDSGSQLADSAPEACTPLTHSNGLGQTYLDCAPLGTHDVTTATEACVAWTNGTSQCVDGANDCGGGAVHGGPDGNGDWATWAYVTNVTGGHVLLTSVVGCPGSSDPMWN